MEVKQPARRTSTERTAPHSVASPCRVAVYVAKSNGNKESTLAGLEPTRDKPNRFLVDRLNHSATVS